MFNKRHTAFFHTLQHCYPSERCSLLKIVNTDVIRMLAEIALNILRGNVKLTKHQFLRLGRYKQSLRTLGNRKVSLKNKRQILGQQGGFLPLLLPVIASLLT
jgi:hypothetical protein